MAQPKWITPAGNLGIVPELEYYEFPLDAYDTTAGNLVYSRVSGVLPPGIQVITTGKLQGIPISTAGPDNNQTYTFTIRVTNASSGNIVDRTFSLTITNVAPPVIIPKNQNLGIYFDGSLVDIQLVAVEFVVEDNLTWRVKDGELPPGITLSSSGLLSGYLRPIPAVGASSDPGWNDTPWDLLGWDFPLGTTSKSFNFTIEVTDGANADTSTYTMFVYPRSTFKADSTVITVDTTIVDSDRLTVDTGARHKPIITTTQAELTPQRAGGYFSFNIDAIDLDDDVLVYSVPPVSSGTFDEQVLSGTGLDYIAVEEINSNISAGAWPKVTISETAATMYLYTGNVITANVGDYITQTASGANARVIANVTNSRTIPLINVGSSYFFTGQGNIAINGTPVVQATFSSANVWANVGVVPFSVSTEEPVTNIDYTAPNLIAGDIVQVLHEDPATTQLKWYEATVNNHTTVRLYGNVKVSASAGNFLTQPVSNANAIITSITSTVGTMTVGGNVVTANVGDYITQFGSSGNATVTSSVANGAGLKLTVNTGDFIVGTGNIKVNGANVDVYPTSVQLTTDVSAVYTNANVFYIDTTPDTPVTGSTLFINNVTTQSTPVSILSVGVAIGGQVTQGEVGFDEGRFSQGALVMPDGLTINAETGWITGYLPYQSINEVTYEFDVVVYKAEYPAYSTSKLFSLSVLGDINNTIDWLTPSNLGTIQNGDICDLSLTAISSKGKSLIYEFTPNSALRLPQGLILTTNGLLAGRVSFEVFTLDQGTTTLDGGATSFDNTYSFSVTASDRDRTIAASRTFTIRVLVRNTSPYEDLYLKALMTLDQRQRFQEVVHDQSVFPTSLIYRSEDPNFGVAADIKTLFLPGLNPSTLEDYTLAAALNHYTKRITFSDIKTAIAVDGSYDVQELSSGNIIGTFQDNIGFVPTNLSLGYLPGTSIPAGTKLIGEHTKYEVVYAEIIDENTNEFGEGPADVYQLSGLIANPYYDADGNAYTTAYPNAFSNMATQMGNELGYANKGALPDWMTSRQADGRVIGFTRAVVLAYTVAGASETIAYRLRTKNINLNEFDFTVDRYQVDNNYSANYDIAAGAFLTSSETTFDRYPTLPVVFTDVGTVDYAVSLPFENINKRSVSDIRASIDLNNNRGLDGVVTFKDGDTLVFARQEFGLNASFGDTYNQGWSDSDSIWDGEPWAYDTNTTDIDTPGGDPTPGLGWDAAAYVTGYNEHNLDPTIPNRRIGVWRINIVPNTTATSTDDIVELEFIQEINLNDKLFVRNGFTHGGTNIYFDPVVKSGSLVPGYSIIPQQVDTVSTKFDGNGTRFYDYRDEYTLPEAGDKYIKFTKTGVFT